MKYLLEKNLFKKGYRGDLLLVRILEIVKEEGIKITIGNEFSSYKLDIDDRIYAFSQKKSTGLGRPDSSFITIYSTDQRITYRFANGGGTYIKGGPISRYKFSNSLWKELENRDRFISDININNEIFKSMSSEEFGDFEADMEHLSDVRRSANKYNL